MSHYDDTYLVEWFRWEAVARWWVQLDEGSAAVAAALQNADPVAMAGVEPEHVMWTVMISLLWMMRMLVSLLFSSVVLVGEELENHVEDFLATSPVSFLALMVNA